MAGSVALASGATSRSGPVPHIDVASAAHILGEHRIAKLEARRIQDRYPRRVGRNSRGMPAGGGGSYQIRRVSTDKGASGWAMSHWPDERVQRFIGTRVRDLFDLAVGTLEDAYDLDLPLHDLVGNILGKPVYALAAEKLVDVFLLDLGIVGFTRWRHVMPELVKAGVLASPHTWAWTPRSYYTAHLAAGVGNVVIVEGIPGKATGVDYSAYKFVDGKLQMPDVPGFGLWLAP
jgi:hypothetical protein